eukprot:173115_1
MNSIICRKRSYYLVLPLIVLIIIIFIYLSMKISYDSKLLHIDGITIVIYDENNTNKFDQYTLENNTSNCKESVYTLYFPHCCLFRLAVNYLYSLGFTNITITTKWKHKKMINNNSTTIGCYGLNIIQALLKYRKQIAINKKTKLYWTTMKYCNEHKLQHKCRKFLPKTYSLTDRSEKTKFLKLLPCNNKPNKNWIIKSDKHRGTGIKFINNSNYIRTFYLTNTERVIANQKCIIKNNYTILYNQSGLEHNAVAQEWIQNSLRIEEYKFHIRSFFLVANFINPMIVLYGDSVIIKATNKESLITNRAVSRKQKGNNQDWIWNMKQFSEYFDVNMSNITQQIKDIAQILFLATQSVYDLGKLYMENEQNYLFTALDLLVTNDFQVKVMEVNIRPASSWVPKNCYKNYFGNHIFDDGWKCRKAKRLMEEMVDIELEIAIKKLNGDNIDKLDSVKYYQTVVWK